MATTSTPKRPASPGGGRSVPPGQNVPPTRSKSPGNRRRKPPKKRGFWYRVKIFFMAITFLILIAFATALAAVYFTLKNTPKTIDVHFNPPGRTQILASDGTLLARMYAENRQVVDIGKIPQNLQNATVDFEDKRFYTHSGVDAVGIGRSLWKNLLNHDLRGQGGSTITQQLARNLGVDGLTTQKSVKRKLHEWVVANQLENTYTKQQILEMYLNDVNYGAGTYGVQAAAQTYFGKNVQDLDLAQCALLAGLPNRPAYYNPYKDKTAAQGQRMRVLEQMLEAKHITPQQFQDANAEKIRLAFAKPPSAGNQIFHAPFFVNYVIDQLKHKYGEEYLLQGNLKIYTTINWGMQQAAEEALRQHIDGSNSYGPNQGCIVALDPKTGEIKAMVGGVDYKTSNFNIVTQARRQPGSLFKLIVYSAAIDSGLVTERTTVLDAPVTYPSGSGPWTPKDDNGYSYRRRTLREAMAYSINVPAVKVIHELGPQTAIRYARVMGISSPLDPQLSLALGSSAVTPLEMTSAYSTIPAGGSHPVPTAFMRLTDIDDKTIEDIPPAIETHVLNSDTVKQIDDMLGAVVTDPYGTGAGANVIPNAHGKTGTTQGHKDVWFIGYTPDLVCGVWAGHPLHNKKTGVDSYGAEMSGGTWGSTVCVPIWRDFMQKALPIFRTANAKEAARVRPIKKAVTVSAVSTASDTNTDTVSETPRHRRRHHSDTSTQTTTDAPDNTNTNTDTDNSAGTTSDTSSSDGSDTVTVNVDNDTGLLAPSGSNNSHLETYAKGTQPKVMAPNYPNADSSSSEQDPNALPGDTPPTPPRRTRTRHSRRNQPAPDNSGDTGSADNSNSAPEAAQPVHHAAPPPPEKVTVWVNPDDGLLATKWTQERVQRTYNKGEEPRRHSTLDGPPPGEH